MEPEIKEQVLDYIRANNGKYNGSEISWNLNNWKITFKELEKENKIIYFGQKWHIVD